MAGNTYRLKLQLSDGQQVDAGTFTAPQGEQGPKGEAGPEGAQGPKGDTGAIGPMGPVGMLAFYVNDEGHLIHTYTAEESVDFSINADGHLIARF